MARRSRRTNGLATPRQSVAHRDRRQPRVLFCLSSPQSADRLYVGQFDYLRRSGFDVAVACPGGDVADRVGSREGVRMLGVDFERSMSPLADIRAVWQLWRVVRREKPDIIVYGTPKAALLASLVGALGRVPARVYVLHGLRLETLVGLPRGLMWLLEWVIGHIST